MSNKATATHRPSRLGHALCGARSFNFAKKNQTPTCVSCQQIEAKTFKERGGREFRKVVGKGNPVDVVN